MVDKVREIDDGSIGLVSKPKTSSAVWNYFGIKSDNLGNPLVAELEKPVCKLCEKLIPAKGSTLQICLNTLRVTTQKHFQKRVKQLLVEKAIRSSQRLRRLSIESNHIMQIHHEFNCIFCHLSIAN